MALSNSSANDGKRKLKDKKILILEQRSVPKPGGFQAKEWLPIHDGQLWAYYRQLSGAEIFAASAVNITENVLFQIGWRPDVNASMKIEYKGHYYDIVRVDTYEGYKNDIRLYCKTGNAPS